MNGIVEKLQTVLGVDVVFGPDIFAGRTRSLWDARPLLGKALLRPRSTEQVALILRLCYEIGQTVVPIGGLSNLVQATDSNAEDILMSLERMNRVESLDVGTATMTVQAGTVLQMAQENAAQAGFMLPVDFGARGSCVIGGMIGTNAGGNRVLRYGMTRDMVLGLEVVLPDGTVISNLTPYLKNNTGYDLKQLFIGSEGTLGVVTRAVLRLYPLPATRQTAMLAVRDFSVVGTLLQHFQRTLGGRLVAFEALWHDWYALNSGKYSRCRPPFTQPYSYYLLVESEGSDSERDGAQFEAALEAAFEAGWLEDAAIASSESERLNLWEIREGGEGLSQCYIHSQTFDVSMALSTMPEYANAVRVQLAQTAPSADLYVFGHVGDGNLHLVVGYRETPDLHAVEQEVYQALLPFHGSVSAEHGIGLEKKAYLGISRSPEEISLMRLLKRAIDSKGILNPGKIFD